MSSRGRVETEYSHLHYAIFRPCDWTAAGVLPRRRANAMAHREQHGNRETKKPKKDRPKAEAQAGKWAVTDRLAAKTQSDR